MFGFVDCDGSAFVRPQSVPSCQEVDERLGVFGCPAVDGGSIGEPSFVVGIWRFWFGYGGFPFALLRSAALSDFWGHPRGSDRGLMVFQACLRKSDTPAKSWFSASIKYAPSKLISATSPTRQLEGMTIV